MVNDGRCDEVSQVQECAGRDSWRAGRQLRLAAGAYAGPGDNGQHGAQAAGPAVQQVLAKSVFLDVLTNYPKNEPKGKMIDVPQVPVLPGSMGANIGTNCEHEFNTNWS